MGKVMTGFSTSLDGFIAGPGDNVEQVFNWFFSGDTEFKYPNGMALKISAASAKLLQEIVDGAGVLVTGRRQFDLTKGWGGKHPLDVPIFVVTHNIPQGPFPEGAPYTFVTDGVESAIKQAQSVAGDKNVIVDGANIVQQAFKAGLIDEFGVDLVPVLLGDGVRFFDHLGSTPIQLENIGVVEGIGVTHLRFRVVK